MKVTYTISDIDELCLSFGILLTSKQLEIVHSRFNHAQETMFFANNEQMILDIVHSIGCVHQAYRDEKFTAWERTRFTVIAESEDDARSMVREMHDDERIDFMPCEDIEDTKEFTGKRDTFLSVDEPTEM